MKKVVMLLFLFIFIVNGNVYGGQIVKNSENNISLFDELSKKREISLGTIANTSGVDIKAVYFKSDNKSLPDNKLLWQSGVLNIKMSADKDSCNNMISNLSKITVPEIWWDAKNNKEEKDRNRVLNSLNIKDCLSKLGLNIDLNNMDYIKYFYSKGINMEGNSVDHSGNIHIGEINSGFYYEYFLTPNVSNHDKKMDLYYGAKIYRKPYETIINATAGQKVIYVNGIEYKLDLPIVLKNNKLYISKNTAEILLNQFDKNYSKELDKFYGNSTILVKDKTYFSFNSVLNLINNYKTECFYDPDLKMVSSISMNLDEMQRTYYGYFK